MKKFDKKKWLLDFLLFAIILGLVFFLPNIILIAKQHFLTTFLKPQKIATIALASGPDAGKSQMFTANGQVMISRPNQLEAYDAKGQLVWTRDLNGQDTRVYDGGETLLIAEMQRGELALIDEKNVILAEVKDLGPIEKIARMSDGNVAALIKNSNQIVILDNQLKNKVLIKAPYGQVVNMKFSHSEPILMVYMTAIRNYNFESYVLQYNMQGEVMASSDCKDMLLYDMQMYDNLVLVGNQKLLSFDKEAQLIAEMETPGYIDHSFAFENKLFLSTLAKDGEAQGTNQLIVLNDVLTPLKSIQLEDGLDGLAVNKTFVVTYVDGVISIFDHGYKEISELQTNLAIEEFIWLSDYTFMIKDAQSVCVYTIK